MKQRDDNIGTVKDLVNHRIKTAQSDIRSAEILLNAGEYRSSNNRAYYGIYHAISAIHALDGNVYRKHKDALANFNKEYVKTEVFPRNIGKRISEAEEIRHASDYDDFYIATKVEAEEQIATAKELLELVSQYCDNKFAFGENEK